MSDHDQIDPRGSVSRPKTVLGLVLGLTTLLVVMLTAFAWPATNSAPRDLPIAIAAPAPVAAQLQQQLSATAGEGAFEVTVVADRPAAVAAIENRDVFGAVVLGQGGGEMLVASGGSPAVAQLLTQLAAHVPQQAGGPLPVTDLVPLPAGDPRGAGLPSAALPLALGGIAGGALIALQVSGRRQKVFAALGLAALGGLALTGVLQGWLGALTGSYWANAGVLGLGIAAVALVVIGMHALLGQPGLGIAAAVTMLLGNPLSGLASAPELLPAGWSTLGQWLPPGATGSALRSTAFFDGAGAGHGLLVLGCWFVVGALLCTFAGHGSVDGEAGAASRHTSPRHAVSA